MCHCTISERGTVLTISFGLPVPIAPLILGVRQINDCFAPLLSDKILDYRLAQSLLALRLSFDKRANDYTASQRRDQ